MVILLFFLLEAGTRIFYPEIKLPGTQQSLLKNSVFYDSQGYKPNSFGLSSDVLKRADESGFLQYSSGRKSKNKILFLGDSVTMGIGVENDSTFTGILNNSSDMITILNPSLIGYSSHDYKNIVKKLIADEKNESGIKHIYIFWCLNDVYSNLPISDSPEIANDSFWNEMAIFLRNNSHFYHLLKSIISDRPKAYYQYDKNFYKSEDKHFKQALNDLFEIDSLANENQLNVDLFLLPYEYQLRDNKFGQKNSPQKLLTKKLKFSNIKTHDCAAAFNIDENVDDYYLFGDGIHFSYQGHKAIAAFIERFFQTVK